MSEPLSAISVFVGSQARKVSAGSTLASLVASLGHPPDAIATALNGDFVRREARADTALAAGDRVTLVRPIVGG